MEFYVTERDRELAREWVSPYANGALADSVIAVERLAEKIAIVRQEERQAVRQRHDKPPIEASSIPDQPIPHNRIREFNSEATVLAETISGEPQERTRSEVVRAIAEGLFAAYNIGCADTRNKHLDDLVDRWHANPGNQPLHEFLGMTAEEYAQWVRHP